MSGIDDSLFVSDTIHEREVELQDGTKHVLHFKELPASNFRRYLSAAYSLDEELQSTCLAKLISQSLCTPDGKPAMTFERALQLRPKAENAIGAAVLEINGMGKKKDDPGKG
jgi:hypothetical protein